VTRRAFTLLELLVTIAVVALLVAILVPAVGASVGRARLLGCLTTSRSLTSAAKAFALDHNERVPIGGRIFISELDTPHEMADLETYTETGLLGETERPLPFTAALAPYLGIEVRAASRALLAADLNDEARLEPILCPAERDHRPGRMIANRTLSWTAPMGLSGYGFNDAVVGVHPASGPRAYGYLTKVGFPSTTLLYADARPRDGDDGLTPHWLSFFNESDDTTLLDCLERTDGGSPSVFDRERHDGSMNATFVDGSGRSVRMDDRARLDAIGISVGVRPYR